MVFSMQSAINPTNIFRLPLVYRLDWMENGSYKTPETLEEFEELMYKFAKRIPTETAKQIHMVVPKLYYILCLVLWSKYQSRK